MRDNLSIKFSAYKYFINYNIMLLKRFASQQSIDYEGLLADFNENPDFEILRMAPSYDKWARESA
jgi:hypothetical protein